MTNLDSIFQSRDINLPTKVRLVKAMVFPVHSEGDKPWDFFGGNDAEAEIPVLWLPDAKN